MIYFKATLKAAMPLVIGSGFGENTGSDILLNADGQPFIPGTTLAGVCRHYFDSEKASEFFGSKLKTKNDMGKQSRIIFYDANVVGDFVISLRDNVRIGDDHVAKGRGKFDYEIIEAGAEFEFRIELDGTQDVIDSIVLGINTGSIRVGAKTTRGYGKLDVDTSTAYLRKLDITKEVDSFINFRWDTVSEIYTPETNSGKSSESKKKYETLTLNFDVDSYLFIRQYATTAHTEWTYDEKSKESKEDKESKMVDAQQLTNAEKLPIIPGTSWAGAFRHHFARILKNVEYKDAKDLEQKVFGYVETDTIKRKANKEKGLTNETKSKVIFSSSTLMDSNLQNRTRTAVDRFTGGAGDGLLFTTRPTYGGHGVLEITLSTDLPNLSFVKRIFDVCIEDINEGFLTVGGESSVGGGFIRVTERKDWR